MKLKFILLWSLMTCSCLSTFAQSEYLIGVVQDSLTAAPLPFATVLKYSGGGVLANENGEFRIELPQEFDTLRISYVGYAAITVPVRRGQGQVVVPVLQTSVAIDEILVLGKDLYASGLFYRAVQESRRDAAYRTASKCFRRSYSFRQGEPSEHMEAFYNAKFHRGGVDAFDLKNGRYGVPSDTSFINLQMTDMLSHFKLFDGADDLLPGAPTQQSSLKRLRKNYDIRILEKFLVEQDTIIEFRFTPLRDTAENFSGKAWVRASNLIIEKIELDIKSTSKRPLLIVPNTEKNIITNMDMQFVIGFKYGEDGHAIMDYIHSFYDMEVRTPVGELSANSNTNFYFYDYGDLFELPFFPNIANYFHDYEKILCFAYDPAFWEKNYLIQETAEEIAFREELERKRLFKNQLGGTQNHLIRRRFDIWDPMWKIEPMMINTREVWEGEEVDNILYVNRHGVPPEYNHFAKTFLFLNYECYADTVIFQTEAVLDYRFSFSIERKPDDFIFLEDFLHLTKIHAQALEQDLVMEYSASDACPDRQILEGHWSEANKELDKAIKEYNVKIHLANAKGRKTLSRNTRKKLAESLMELEN